MLEPDANIHQPTRLRIMMLLSGVAEADFNFLLSTLGLSNGNLSVQAGKLEQVGYLEITKSFVGKMPRTMYRLTDLGREHLREYWETMDAIRASSQQPAPIQEAS
jgi:DNA-binding transcriptional ArsR family regulator